MVLQPQASFGFLRRRWGPEKLVSFKESLSWEQLSLSPGTSPGSCMLRHQLACRPRNQDASLFLPVLASSQMGLALQTAAQVLAILMVGFMLVVAETMSHKFSFSAQANNAAVPANPSTTTVTGLGSTVTSSQYLTMCFIELSSYPYLASSAQTSITTTTDIGQTTTATVISTDSISTTIMNTVASTSTTVSSSTSQS